ncbi:MAG: hypothetical protein ISR91_01110 [Candidatus Delongbacteria bacterium]|nr:hypothetical protein [Candidatus Delongbacteria bacterium]
MSRNSATFIRKFSIPQPRVFVLLAAVLLLLLIFFGGWEYRAHKHQLVTLLREEAIQVSHMLSLGGERVMHASRELEDQLTERLLDKARLLDLMEQERELTPKLLKQLLPDSSLMRVLIFDSDGKRIFPPLGRDFATGPRNRRPGVKPGRPPQGPPPRSIPLELEVVLTGEQQVKVIGEHRSQFRRNPNFLLAYHRTRGGAFVLRVDVAHLERRHRNAGIAGLLERIHNRPNVAWVGLYDSDNLLESNSGRFPQLAEKPPSLREQAEFYQVVDTTGQKQTILDVTVPLRTPFLEQGYLRVGFTGDRLDASRTIFIRSLLIRSGIFLLLGLLMLYYFLVYSNYRTLAREYDAIREEVEQLEQEKQVATRLQAMGELASGVAHEVRNPLNSIRMISQRLHLEFNAAQDEEYQRLTHTLKEESDRINRIITDFLTFARPAPLRRKLNSLADCITQTVAGLRPGFEAAGCKLELNLKTDPIFEFDLDRLSQVFHNLLANTLPAVSADGRVVVDVSRRGGIVHISISDNGHGITPENIDRIFNLYFTTRAEGSGIGLAVTHQIISEHGGSIRVESKLDQGTTFIIDLPEQRTRAHD